MSRIALSVIGVIAAALSLAPAYGQNEALERLASQLREAPVAAGSNEDPLRFFTRPAVHAEHVMHGEPEPERVESGATQRIRYQYDDNSFEGGLGTEEYAIQGAQRFRLRDTGTIRWLEACFWRQLSDFTSGHSFAFDILSDRNGSPGSSLIGGRELIKSGTVPSNQRDACFRLNYSRSVSARTVWVAVLFFGDDGLQQNGLSGQGKVLSGDTGSPRNTVVRGRLIEGSGGQVTGVGSWRGVTNSNAFGIRMAVDHETVDPEPPSTRGPCLPTTDVLQFDGDYRVRMCYVTGEGETGQAQAGVWASSQSGILWFFSRENAEVLVKVLDGCRHNDYRWVFVAPVTTLGFELRITGPDGRTWTHTNQVNQTASTKSDTSAFRCR